MFLKIDIDDIYSIYEHIALIRNLFAIIIAHRLCTNYKIYLVTLMLIK